MSITSLIALIAMFKNSLVQQKNANQNNAELSILLSAHSLAAQVKTDLLENYKVYTDVLNATWIPCRVNPTSPAEFLKIVSSPQGYPATCASVPFVVQHSKTNENVPLTQVPLSVLFAKQFIANDSLNGLKQVFWFASVNTDPDRTQLYSDAIISSSKTAISKRQRLVIDLARTVASPKRSVAAKICRTIPGSVCEPSDSVANPVPCLDPTFGVNGRVTRRLNRPIDTGSSVNIQTDGQILLAGYDSDSNGNLADILRFNSDGSVDSSYAVSGYRRTRIHLNTYHTTLRHSAIQPDGKVLAIGHNRYDEKEGGGAISACDAFTVVRLLTDGSLDTTFSGDGMLSYNPLTNEADDEFGWGGILPQPDGKIILSGMVDTGTRSFPDDQMDGAVARLNANGTVDTTFGTGGRTVRDLSGASKHDYIRGVVLQPDGKILNVGYSRGSNYDFLLWRLNPNGTNDISFDGDGKVTTAFGTGDDKARAVGLQTDGKILVVGSTVVGTYAQWVVARYLPSNGALDTSFNGTGFKIIPQLSTASGEQQTGEGITQVDPQNRRLSTATRVKQLANGKILVTGSAHNGNNYDMAAAILNLDGTLDTTFNGTGYMLIEVGSYNDFANGMDVQSNGMVVLGGHSYTTGDYTSSDFALVRFNPLGCQ